VSDLHRVPGPKTNLPYRKQLAPRWRTPMDVTNLQDRRSLFGITVRRARLNWIKLSFQGQVEFVKLYQAWLKGEWSGNSLPRSEPGRYHRCMALPTSNSLFAQRNFTPSLLSQITYTTPELKYTRSKAFLRQSILTDSVSH
jgi:hypothetical protein